MILDTMQLFNKQIRLRDYVCSPTGGYACSNNQVNLYIYASGYCPAKCSFCSGFHLKSKTDHSKLKTVLCELHNKKVINRIAITGGEPLIDLSSLDNILGTIYDVCGSHYHISVNTNGTNLSLLRNIEHYSLLNDVHISRHSNKDYENDDIFGIRTPTSAKIRQEVELGPNIFSLSCNLMHGYIDSPIRLREYLDDAIKLGVYQVGFVSLMHKTLPCNELFVDYEDITSKLHVRDGFLFEKMAKDKLSCKCENFSYYNEHGNISFYLRRVLGGINDCVKAFIFNQENNLVINFGKDMVLL